MSIFDHYRQRYEEAKDEELSLQEFLDVCREDRSAYVNAAERLLMAIGEPEMIDTAQNPRLSRLFSNRVIARYKTFEEFYGMEEAIEQIVSYLKHAAQGLEERKQILYLLGPVGGGKSSLAEKLKSLMQKVPIYILTANGERSPVNDHPFCLFDKNEDGDLLKNEYGIPKRYLNSIMSPWAAKRLHEFGGDITKFKVVKVRPSILDQVGVAKTEPGDENNQDISSLVGKVDIRQLEHFSQDDPDAYSYCGALCKANQGLMEFVEMFKAPLKVLHPLLTATQEGNYNGTEGLSALPFDGMILAHSNESEWQSFRNNKTNEAFLDRVYIVKVPYCLRISEEMKIYEKLLQNSQLSTAPCSPSTLDILARFSVLSRLKEPENSSVYSKMRVYDGETLKDTDPKAKSYQEYRDYAGVDEGMNGLSTRFAFKILSRVFNFDHSEVAANPVHLFYVLEQQIEREQFPQDLADKYLEHLKGYLIPKYVEFIGKEIQTAYLESYSEYGQNIFDRYVSYADFWIQDQEYRDPETGQLFDRAALNNELEKIEKPAGISNPKDFRNEIVNFVLRARANHSGKNPNWTSYEKLRTVIEKKMFSNTEELLPVISFNAKTSSEEQKKHDDFVARMMEKGYTRKQVRLLSEWYLRVRKSS
ncbi:PrkA family serine protein kinase [Photobacterium damselae subsp. piscicida]|uniref:Serine/threonine kinase YeaG n=1 Tax=Photobacterium damsela subsp. piscicida TaxID=38294 RepID=A0A1Q9H7F6_PHODP|nr:PrkA family serine protein kinase [Photobacterium damselae]MBE8128720.1 PrkA family serine protein kinase [Photobacterium damselae subsp. piscicida]OLQ83666.1 PrkA family serine protein kinase [Photobacterium damselae subsp. piscicida]PSV74879.1 PrkA family serine protein kinase [Photobacterium damselae]PSW77974.1 PrkA family serine protein kinase [Photobacterium damselae]QOD53416.1 PrkA family serine protein kinase [Photobacterium damselae subsp. piscicida]